MTLPAEGRSAVKLLEIFLTSLTEERRVAESDPILEAIRPNVMAMWDYLPSFLKTALSERLLRESSRRE